MNETRDYFDFPGADTLQAAGRVAPPSAQAVDRARSAVLTAVSAEAASQTQAQAQTQTESAGLVATPVRPRRMLSGRRLVAMFALAAAAAGVVVATGTGPAPTQSPSAAAQQPSTAQQSAAGATTFLNGVGDVAETQSASTAPYWKMRLRSVVGSHTSTTTTYVSRSGYVIKANGKTYTKGAPVWSVGAKLVNWNGLDRLPTNPATLLSMMSAAQPEGLDVFGQAGNILGCSPASPALRGGLFKALGKLHGVKMIGTTKDSAGRTGTELAYAGPNATEALIIDPKTATVLETVFWQAGTVSRTTFLTVGPALSID